MSVDGTLASLLMYEFPYIMGRVDSRAPIHQFIHSLVRLAMVRS